MKLYLWLCREGRVRFGPFEWLRFDDDRKAILRGLRGGWVYDAVEVGRLIDIVK